MSMRSRSGYTRKLRVYFQHFPHSTFYTSNQVIFVPEETEELVASFRFPAEEPRLRWGRAFVGTSDKEPAPQSELTG